MPWLCKLAM